MSTRLGPISTGSHRARKRSPRAAKKSLFGGSSFGDAAQPRPAPAFKGRSTPSTGPGGTLAQAQGVSVSSSLASMVTAMPGAGPFGAGVGAGVSAPPATRPRSRQGGGVSASPGTRPRSAEKRRAPRRSKGRIDRAMRHRTQLGNTRMPGHLDAKYNTELTEAKRKAQEDLIERRKLAARQRSKCPMLKKVFGRCTKFQTVHELNAVSKVVFDALLCE